MDNALLAMGLKHKDERIAELEEAAREALHAWEEDETQQMIYSAMRKLRKVVAHD